jgi:hypothetical protein
MEPPPAMWRLVTMRARLPTAAGLPLLSWLVAGCDSDEQGSATCSLTTSIKFEGREYIAVDSLQNLNRSEVRAGKRLGTGEPAICRATGAFSAGLQGGRRPGCPSRVLQAGVRADGTLEPGRSHQVAVRSWLM